MFAIPNQQYDTIKPFVEEAVAKESRTITDGGHNLIKLKELVKEHIPYPETEEDVHEVVKTKLPWVHIITGECRSGIEVIHKDVDKRFLQLYLNEYCWKFNRRFFRDSKKEKFDLFDHLIRISAQYTSDIKWRDYEKMANAICLSQPNGKNKACHCGMRLWILRQQESMPKVCICWRKHLRKSKRLYPSPKPNLLRATEIRLYWIWPSVQ